MSKLFKRLIAVMIVAIVSLTASVCLIPSKQASADTSYAYRLDFSNENAFGKNTGDSAYADATVTGSFTKISGPNNQSAIQFPASAGQNYSNYLSLPTSVFANAESATVAGWFRVPSNIVDYTCELCIFSPESNKTLRVDPFASLAGGGALIMYGNALGWSNEIRPLFDAWRHIA